jgi:hypothetical protein
LDGRIEATEFRHATRYLAETADDWELAELARFLTGAREP